MMKQWVLMGSFLATLCAFGAQTSKPKVVYILCDDLGYGEVGYNGQKLIQTPELDALAGQGMRFTSHYCGSSVCAPSRCILMTGQHAVHAAIRANSPGYPNGQTIGSVGETDATRGLHNGLHRQVGTRFSLEFRRSEQAGFRSFFRLLRSAQGAHVLSGIPLAKRGENRIGWKGLYP